MVFEENFLRSTITVRFKKRVLQKGEFSYYFFSVSYDKVVATKQIYFSSTFLRSWIHISDNIAGVVGGSQYYKMKCKYWEGGGDLFP